MIFNSFEFVCFFSIFFILYWFVVNRNLKLQNLVLLVACYIFYAWVDWRFLAYLIGSSFLNYYLGIYIEKSSNPTVRKILVYVGLIQGVGGLAYFKYFNFFISSFNDAFNFLGSGLNLQTLHIIIPLGISFFTFKTLSYILDIDKGKMKATHDWVVFFAYVSFFPTIVAGPIDRAKGFIPQLEKKRVFSNEDATHGLRQILWGLFKKIVIADNCGSFVNQAFNNYHSLPASTLLLGAFFYTIELYADFSGYSDMAIGIARLIGFQVTKNFNFPFFSQNIAEYWRKWHMSLTSWLTDYVFTPLSIAFRDYGKLGLALAIIINFTICGIWHGANWTYVLFGFMHGCYFIPLIIAGTMNKKKKITTNKMVPSFKEALNMLGTFTLVMLTLVVFRSDTIKQAFQFYHDLISPSLFSVPMLAIFDTHKSKVLAILAFIFLMFIIEWFQREKDYGLQIDILKSRFLRWSIYYAAIIAIMLFISKQETFIYAKF
jgi:alginate O-acetyltransferase complex protein AlgI